MIHEAAGIAVTRRRTARLIASALVLAAGVLAGCKDNTSPSTSIPVAAAVRPAVADTQAGTVGTLLVPLLAVRVVDANGNPVPGASVTFTVSSDASVSPATAISDDSGLAKTAVTLGTVAGQIVVTATDSSIAPITFVLTATPDTAAILAKVSGDSQSTGAGTPAPVPLVVQLTDAYGNPIHGLTVSWTTSGAGTLGSATSVTDATGHAQTTFTLDPAAGVQTVTATVGSLAPVTFTETGT